MDRHINIAKNSYHMLLMNLALRERMTNVTLQRDEIKNVQSFTVTNNSIEIKK